MISTDPTAATPNWSAPVSIDGLAAGTPSLRGLPTTSGPTVTFGFSCSGESLQECHGAAIVTTTERLAANGRSVTGVAATAKTKRHRTVVVGRTSFTRIANTARTYTVRVKLNGAGKRLLARFRRLPATLSVTANASELRAPPKIVTVKTVKVTFRATPQAAS